MKVAENDRLSKDGVQRIGNPTGDGTWSYTWQAGRQLASMSKTGTALSFSYDFFLP